MDWEEELNKAVEESRNSVSYVEWLLSGDDENLIFLDDKIEQMPSIKDLPNSMQPEIEIGDSNGRCKIIYCHPVGAYDYFYIWAETGMYEKAEDRKQLRYSVYVKDLTLLQDWPSLLKQKAKEMLDEVTLIKIFRHIKIRLSLVNVFYSYHSHDEGYFLGHSWSED